MPPAKRALLVMRVLIVLGLALTGGLTWMHHGGANVPLCGDCQSVLDSHWSMVYGIPVALLGFIGYLLLLVSSVRYPRCPWSLGSCAVLATALAGGGVWFIGVQAFDLHQWCLWCTVTHAVSIVLAAIIVPITWRRAGNRFVAAMLVIAGMVMSLTLMTMQLDQRPPAAQTVGSGESGFVNDDGELVLLGGAAKVAMKDHIIIGSPDAKKFVLEAMDFRCHGCARAWPMIEQAQQLLGGEVAVVVLVTPLCADCNPYIKNTAQGFEASCELAKLAWAVWLAAPDQYLPFHRWLLTHQAATVDEAKTQARQIVGEPLDDALADPSIDARIHNDVTIASGLDLLRLPGMIAGRLRLGIIPDDAQTLAMLWSTGLSTPKKGQFVPPAEPAP